MSDELAGPVISPAELPGRGDWELRPMGDRAVLVRLRLPQGTASFQELSAKVRYNRMLAARTLAARLQATVPAEGGWPREFVPGYDSVLAPFDPAELQTRLLYDWLHSQIEQLTHEWQSNGLREAASSRLHRIPVKYGGERGPDLEAVARRNGLTPNEVVKYHTSATYSVYLVGFAPGFAYLGALPPEIDAPRLERPRPQVPAGTVALAAGLTGVYPLVMPGGWNLIGYTALPMFDPTQTPPVRFLPGDKVQFFKDEG
jgi:KipI family sensor histidine kinase inhibitor